MTQEMINEFKRLLPRIETLEQSEKRRYSTKDVALMLRKNLKVAYHGFVFSITKESYAGGSALNVVLRASPLKAFKTWDELSEVQQLRKEQDGRDKEAYTQQIKSGHAQINQYYIKELDSNVSLTDEMRGVFIDIIEYVNQFNYDNSDSRIDYFDVHFYANYSIGSYDRAYEQVNE